MALIHYYDDIMAVVKERLRNWQLAYDDKTNINKIFEDNRDYVYGIVERIVKLHDHARDPLNNNDEVEVKKSFAGMDTAAAELVDKLKMPFPASKFTVTVLWARVAVM